MLRNNADAHISILGYLCLAEQVPFLNPCIFPTFAFSIIF